MYIRASTASDANTYSYQKLVIDGLTYQPSAYYFLRLTNTTTGEYYDVNSSGYNGGGSSPNYYTIALRFSVSPNTTNYYKAEARYLSSNSTTTVTNQLTSPSAPAPVYPSTPSINGHDSFGKTVNFIIATGSNTTGLQIERSWTSAYTTGASSYVSYNISLSVPAYETQYWIRARATNSDGASSYTPYYYFTSGADNVVPTISSTVIDYHNGITLSWSASDDSGNFRSPPYSLYISGENNSSLTFIASTSNTSYTFTTDANGNLLKNGSTYLVRVYVYDAKNNSSYVDKSVTVVRNRPANFAWNLSKNSGSSFNLTATEWNNLTYRINEFRQYRGYNNYSFVNAITGNNFTAPIFNEAVSTISGLSPQISPPSTRATGNDIYASYFNLLRDSLNSIQ